MDHRALLLNVVIGCTNRWKRKTEIWNRIGKWDITDFLPSFPCVRLSVCLSVCLLFVLTKGLCSKHQLRISLLWLIYNINLVDETKLSCLSVYLLNHPEIRERRRQRAQWKNGFGAWIDRSFFSGEKRRLILDINVPRQPQERTLRKIRLSETPLGFMLE